MRARELEELDIVQLLKDGEYVRFNEIRERSQFAMVSLAGANLVFADLTEAHLRNIDLTEANLSGADLTEVDLAGSIMTNADLSGADLRRSNLTDVDMCGANLTGAVLTGSNLSSAHLVDAVLGGADLSSANLSHADLRRADLREAILSHVTLRGAQLEDCLVRPEDALAVGYCFEELADLSIKNGDFDGARRSFKEANSFYLKSRSFTKSADLLRKQFRLRQSLNLAQAQIEELLAEFLLEYKTHSDEWARSGDGAKATRCREVMKTVQEEISQEGAVSRPREPAETHTVEPLEERDVLRYVDTAVGVIQRYSLEDIYRKTGEVISLMTRKTGLALTERFQVPDLFLESPPPELQGAPQDQLDRARGLQFLEVIRERMRKDLCEYGGRVHRRWVEGDRKALFEIVTLVHERLSIPSPYQLVTPLMMAYLIKSDLDAFCGWPPGERDENTYTIPGPR